MTDRASKFFERFTERAIGTIMLAQEESRRLGFNYVGSEQILLGLIGIGSGHASKTLRSLGVTLARARVETEKITGRGDGRVAIEVPFTARAKRILEHAWKEARRLGDNFVGTEHLLLGLIKEEEGVAIRVLENLGIDLAQVSLRLRRQLKSHQSSKSVISFYAVRKASKDQAFRVGDVAIGAEHFLLGLAAIGSESAADYLKQAGVDYLKLCEIFDSLQRERGKSKGAIALLMGQKLHKALPLPWFSASGHEVIELARKKCDLRLDRSLNADHVAFGVLSSNNEFVLEVLRRAGINSTDMLEAIERCFTQRDDLLNQELNQNPEASDE